MIGDTIEITDYRADGSETAVIPAEIDGCEEVTEAPGYPDIPGLRLD